MQEIKINKLKTWLHPSIIFNLYLIAALIIYLISNISYRYTDLSKYTIFLIIVLSISNFTGYFLSCFFSKKSGRTRYTEENYATFTNLLLILIISIFIVETIYFKGFPLLGYFGISSPTYSEYGINGLHGASNAFFYTYIIINFNLYITSSNKKYRDRIILSLIYPVLMANRGTLVIATLSLIFLYIHLKPRINYKEIFLALFAIIILAIIFAQVGQNRSEFNINEYIDTDIHYIFLWLIMYTISSLQNLAYALFLLEHNQDPELIFDAFNATTSYYIPLVQYGIVGMIFLSMLNGFIGSLLFRKSTYNIGYFQALCYYTVISTLSLFGNFLHSTSNWMLIVMLVLFTKYRIKW